MFNCYSLLKSLRLAPGSTVILLLLAAQLHAQQGQSPADRTRLAFEARLSHVVKAMTARVNAENAELNARINAMNEANPLEKLHLDSVSVSANVSRVLNFIEYLKRARASSDSLARDYEDSLYILAVSVPPDINAH